VYNDTKLFGIKFERNRVNIQNIQRENDILLAMMATKMCLNGIPNINSLEFQVDLARFLTNPEFHSLQVTVIEVMDIMNKAVAFELKVQERLKSS